MKAMLGLVRLLRRKRAPGLLRDRRGMAAVEFALIAPTLIFLVIGVLEMSLRFRAKEETTRYTHQVADLLGRESKLTTADITAIYNAAPNLMKPLNTLSRLDVDISSIGFAGASKTPFVKWRRVAGQQVNPTLSEYNGFGGTSDSLIRVAVRYHYSSPLTAIFGGRAVSVIEEAVTRPREVSMIPINGSTDDGGAVVAFGG